MLTASYLLHWFIPLSLCGIVTWIRSWVLAKWRGTQCVCSRQAWVVLHCFAAFLHWALIQPPLIGDPGSARSPTPPLAWWAAFLIPTEVNPWRFCSSLSSPFSGWSGVSFLFVLAVPYCPFLSVYQKLFFSLTHLMGSVSSLLFMSGVL